MANNIKYFSTVKKLSVTRVPKVFLSLYARGSLVANTDSPYGIFERRLHSYSIGEYEQRFSIYRNNNEQNEDFAKDGYHCREFILQSAVENKSIIVVCSGVARALTLINFWELLDNGDCKIKIDDEIDSETGNKKSRKRGYIAVGEKVEILECMYKSARITFVSICNYGDLNIANIFESIGDNFQADLAKHGEDDDAFPDNLSIQRAIAKWYSSMLIRWKADDCGTWKNTASQLSHSIYRRKFMKSDETHTRKPELDRLERSSLFGGRAEVYYAGDVCDFVSSIATDVNKYNRSNYTKHTESIYRLDVTSMYPYIFSAYEVPGKMIYHSQCYDLRELKYALQSDKIICAAVRLNNKIPEYPCRIHAKRIVKNVVVNQVFKTDRQYLPSTVKYPVGLFDTVLIGEELNRAYNEGSIMAIYEYSVYDKSKEYQDFMTYLLNKREAARIERNVLNENFWKLVANSFGGKLAQRNRGWKAYDGQSEIIHPWGQWYVLNGKDDIIEKFRSISWNVQKYYNDEYSPKGKPIVWSYVCSIGRIIMRDIRQSIDRNDIIQQDTDGLYVTQSGYDKLCEKNIIQNRAPGKLRLVSKHRHVRFWGPRHYIVDNKFVMSGLSVGTQCVEGNLYTHSLDKALDLTQDNHAPEYVCSTKAIVNLRCDIEPTRIDEHGNVKDYSVDSQFSWKPFSQDNMGVLFRGLKDYG